MRQLICVSILLFVSNYSAMASPEDFIIKRLDDVRNFSVEYERTTKSNPDPNLKMPELRNGLKPEGNFGPRIEFHKDEYRRSDASYLYESTASEETLRTAKKSLSIVKMIVSRSPNRYESAHWLAGEHRPAGSIDSQGNIPFGLFVDVGLGVRLLRNQWIPITRDFLKEGVITSENNAVIWTYKEKSGSTHALCFDPKLGYALTRYDIKSGDGESSLEIIASDFREVDGIMLPFSLTKENTYRDTSGKMRKPIRTELKVTRYQIEKPSNKPVELMIRWPAGTSVLDMRTNVHFDIEDPKGTVLTDETIFKILTEREAGKQAELDAARKRIEEAKKNPATIPAD